MGIQTPLLFCNYETLLNAMLDFSNCGIRPGAHQMGSWFDVERSLDTDWSET